jgi:serine/threonine-protein kinase HipA
MAALIVYMNGIEVGEYINHSSGAQEFIYNDNWLEQSAAVPLSLSLPLTAKIHKGDAVHNYFDNLLPDNLEIRNRIQNQFGSKTNKPFDLLADIGMDCVGAIQLFSGRTDVDIKKIECTAVSDSEIAKILKDHQNLPLGMSNPGEFRISIAGAQEKTAFLWHKNHWQRPTGSTPTTHIFKQPIGRIHYNNIDLSDSIENEWLCLKILKAFGLPAVNTSIKTFDNVKVLVAERFDRELAKDKSWIIRQPQEDMCQALGFAPVLKYESNGGPGISNIMTLLSSAINAEENRKRFMKSVFLFWLLGAIDGHAKNFSIFLKQRGRFELTPLYDVISAFPLIEKKQVDLKDIKMAMALHGKNNHYHLSDIVARHWFTQSKRDNFPESEMRKIMTDAIDAVDDVIAAVSSDLPETFPDDIAAPVFEGMRSNRDRTLHTL